MTSKAPFHSGLYITVFTLTLGLSAFLLFSVQPLFGKMILPLLGGSPSVWNTAMVFFQAALLAGYLYAHFMARTTPPRWQPYIHLALLVVFVIILPISLPDHLSPPETGNPVWWQLGLMSVIIGGPFLVLSASAPLLQHWFSLTPHPDADNPYFLYGASNIGSLGALLAYPFVIEPLAGLYTQQWVWALGYGLLIFGFAVCALLIGRGAKAEVLAATAAPDVRAAKPPADNVKPATIGLWLILAFIPSSAMLGATTFITTDLAPVPLLWLLPLAIYVSSFIIAFARKPLISLDRIRAGHSIFFFCVALSFLFPTQIPVALTTLLHLGLLAFIALLCHVYLVRFKPHAVHLTVFYLIMATGGVLGGIFNALIAPVAFTVPAEYVLIIAASLFVRHLPWKTEKAEKTANISALLTRQNLPLLLGLVSAGLIALADDVSGKLFLSFPVVLLLFFYKDHTKGRAFALLGSVFLFSLALSHWYQSGQYVHRERNFYGTMAVTEKDNFRSLIHGTTLHGLQSMTDSRSLTPMGYYYNQETPLGDIFAYLNQQPGEQKIASIGLGAGTLACYQRNKRSFDFYEIDPDVARIAENKDYFSYLTDCGSDYRIIIGDGRLKLQDAPDHSYDMIFLDAFSSDSIPVHLLTGEAFDLYLQKLKPGGLIAAHISNRYLNLVPIIATIAAQRDIPNMIGIRKIAEFNEEISVLPSMISVLQADREKASYFQNHTDWYRPTLVFSNAWQDDYSNIFQAFIPLQKTVARNKAYDVERRRRRIERMRQNDLK